MKIDRAIEILDPETTAEALAEVEYYGGFRGNEALVKACEDACIVAVDALKRARWIPCSERLPEDDKKVLVYIPPRDGTTQYGYYIAQMREVKGDAENFCGIQTADSPWTVWAWGYFVEPIVTHWMPLPEPPRKEE